MSELKSSIEYVLGISFESDNGLAIEFDGSPELIPMLQDRLKLIDISTSDRITLSICFDEILLEAIRLLKPGPLFNTSSGDATIATLDDSLFHGCKNSKTELVIWYLTKALERHTQAIKQYKDNDKSVPSELSILLERIQVTIILFLRGLTNSGCTYNEICATFTRLILLNKFPNIFYDLISTCMNVELVDFDAFSEVFNPVLDKLRTCALMIRLNQAKESSIFAAEQTFKALSYLLNIKLPNNSRPIADLLVSRDDFLPSDQLNGLIYFKTSYLGPFIGMTLAQLQSNDNCFDDVEDLFGDFTDKYHSEIEKSKQFNTYHTYLSTLRVELHMIFKSVLTNANSREQTLSYIAKVVECNKKLSQLHVNHDELASSPAMLQLASVLLDLSCKVQIDKVQEDYIFHPNARVNVKDDARISMDSTVLESYSSSIDLFYTPNFNTECFYLTIESLAISLGSIYSSLKELKRELPHLEDQVKKLEEQTKSLSGDDYLLSRYQRALKHAKKTLKRVILSIFCYECLIYDPIIQEKCADFIDKFMHLLLRSITPNGTDIYPINGQISCFERYKSFPERYLETILDFLIFLTKKERSEKLCALVDLPRHLAIMATNMSLIKNPHLGSKVVELLFYLCPSVNPKFSRLFNMIIEDRESVYKLFPSLVKFYADVETTGSHTEFYDKFFIRRNLQIIFKYMWEDLVQRDRIIRVAKESGQDFIRFINMLLNDNTFLLDESLTYLKQIHDIEVLMNNEQSWNALTAEERQGKTEALTAAKSSVTSWLQLGNQTMELLMDLTKGAPSVFLGDALGERVASMLNYNLVQLCGPKCSELKVQDAAKRFQWNPRMLTEQIVEVYLNLAGETFAKQMAQDERSYAPDIFAAIIEKLRTRGILTISLIEGFKHLCERAEFHWQEKVQNEEDFGDDIPDEFRDEIVYNVMRDPVVLPSGQVVDRKIILRHLLSDPTNPFTRQPLTPDQLVPNLELKQRIDDWIRELRNRRNQFNTD